MNELEKGYEIATRLVAELSLEMMANGLSIQAITALNTISRELEAQKAELLKNQSDAQHMQLSDRGSRNCNDNTCKCSKLCKNC